MKLKFYISLIGIAVVLCCCVDTASCIFTLIRFNETYATEKGARCLDGTPAAFFGETGLGASVNKWVIALQGGGWCFDRASCLGRAVGSLGSSNGYPATVARLTGILSSDQASNPDFYDWNHVYIPYCSGDLHSGTRMDNSSVETWGLYFCGRNNFVAILDYLVSSFRLNQATEIIVAGDSAGAIGSWIHSESVASRFPSARVVNIPNAGYFSVETLYPAGDLVNPFDFLKNQSSVWQSYYPPSCGDSRDPENKWYCLLSEFSAPTLPTATFWIQAVLDTNLLQDQLGFPGFSPSTDNSVTFDWLGDIYISRLNKLQAQIFSRDRDGWWITSALYHTIPSTANCQKEGVSWLQTAGNWYFNRTGIQRLFDECGGNNTVAIYASGAQNASASCALTRQCNLPPSTAASTPSSVSQPPVQAPTISAPASTPLIAGPQTVPSPVGPVPPTDASRTSDGESVYSMTLITVHLLLSLVLLATL